MEIKNILKKFEESLIMLAIENRLLWKREMCESEDIEKYGLNEFVGGKADAYEDCLDLLKKLKTSE
jgi:hypothetical protein